MLFLYWTPETRSFVHATRLVHRNTCACPFALHCPFILRCCSSSRTANGIQRNREYTPLAAHSRWLAPGLCSHSQAQQRSGGSGGYGACRTGRPCRSMLWHTTIGLFDVKKDKSGEDEQFTLRHRHLFPSRSYRVYLDARSTTSNCRTVSLHVFPKGMRTVLEICLTCRARRRDQQGRLAKLLEKKVQIHRPSDL